MDIVSKFICNDVYINLEQRPPTQMELCAAATLSHKLDCQVNIR